jgi:hypothetical protein
MWSKKDDNNKSKNINEGLVEEKSDKERFEGEIARFNLGRM